MPLNSLSFLPCSDQTRRTSHQSCERPSHCNGWWEPRSGSTISRDGRLPRFRWWLPLWEECGGGRLDQGAIRRVVSEPAESEGWSFRPGEAWGCSWCLSSLPRWVTQQKCCEESLGKEGVGIWRWSPWCMWPILTRRINRGIPVWSSARLHCVQQVSILVALAQLFIIVVHKTQDKKFCVQCVLSPFSRFPTVNCMGVEVSFRWCWRHGAAAVKVRGIATISWQGGLGWCGA